MSELEKIKEQEDVMNSYNQNLVVSASAGSGKTSVMIRKIIDYILNRGLTVKDILVLTYTNFASEEMKQKLISALKEASILRQDIFEQLDDVPLADISTFDSFCQKIVKKYFYLIDVDPSFSVLDESEQTFYHRKTEKGISLFLIVLQTTEQTKIYMKLCYQFTIFLVRCLITKNSNKMLLHFF